MQMIDSFRGDYDFLSNFSYSPVEFDGVVYPTVEHAFQAAKTMNPEERQLFLKGITPGQAKRLGKKVQLRPAWPNVKVAIMRNLLVQKFKNPELAKKLLDTGDALLVEGNNWNDRFWGICRGKGENHLGRLLMEVRDLLRESP